MIRIDITMYPHGNSSRARAIGSMIITNNGTGTKSKGNYSYTMSTEKTKKYKTGEVKNFPRLKNNVWTLILRVLWNAFIEQEVFKGAKGKRQTLVGNK